MSSSEKFCLKWYDFQQNVSDAFGSLRNSIDFADVTLVSQDGEQVDAHRVILSASSPFFENILTQNKHSHPLIYMRGVTSEDLAGIIDFLYYGEANIHQGHLDAFLALAEELKLNGLTRKTKETNSNISDEVSSKLKTKRRNKLEKSDTVFEANQSLIYDQTESIPETTSPHIDTTQLELQSNYSEDQVCLKIKEEIVTENTFHLQRESFSGDIKELEEKISSMMSKGKSLCSDGRKARICHVCGMEGRGFNIQQHIALKHIEVVSILCKLCDKSFKSMRKIKRHFNNDHAGTQQKLKRRNKLKSDIVLEADNSIPNSETKLNYQEPRQKSETTSYQMQLDSSDIQLSSKIKQEVTPGKLVHPKKESFSGDVHEMEAKIRSMMSTGKSVCPDGRKSRICHACGMEGRPFNIQQHIANRHIEVVNIFCKLCDQTFRSIENIKRHLNNDHSSSEVMLSNKETRKVFAGV